MKFGKNLFALLLALVMVVSLIPTAVFAEEEGVATPCEKCGLTEGHTEGCETQITCEKCNVKGSHAENCETQITCEKCNVKGGHAEGCETQITCEKCNTQGSHAEGCETQITCEKCNTKGGHAEGCETQITCEKCNVKGGHAEDCPSYAAPTPATCTKQEGCTDGVHAGTCPLVSACGECGLKGSHAENCAIGIAAAEAAAKEAARVAEVLAQLDAKLESMNPYLEKTGLTKEEKYALQAAIDEFSQYAQENTVTPTDEQMVSYNQLVQFLIDTPTVYENPFDALKDPDNTDITITLTSDLDMSGWSGAVINGKNVTINGGGYTLSGMTDSLLANIVYSTVSIENLTISGTQINTPSERRLVGAFIGEIGTNAVVTLSGCHTTGANMSIGDGWVGGLIGYGAGSSVTITGCSVINSTLTTTVGAAGGIGGQLDGNGSSVVTITNSTVSGCNITFDEANAENRAPGNYKAGAILGTSGAGADTISVTESGNTVRNGGKTTKSPLGRIVDGTTNITGGSYETDDAWFQNLAASNTLKISGGTFTSEVPAANISNGFALESGQNGTYIVTKAPAVAKIGDVEYTDLAAAFADAKDGDTITLLEDLDLSSGWTSVVVNKAITLDGNGKTISGLTQPLISNASADLTIKDLTFTGANIEVKSAAGADNDTSAAVVVQWHNGGTLTMNGVNVNSSTVKGDGYAAALVGFVDSTAAYTNLNATVSGVNLTAGGTAGTFIGHSWAEGNLTGSVSGNTITSTSDGNTRPDKAGIVIGRTNKDTTTIAVTVGDGNTLNPAGTNPQRIVGSIPGGAVVINGGSYPADPRLTDDSNGATATISKLCKITEENGRYIVTKAPAVAKIGDVEYVDLKEAFEDLMAAGGGTIDLVEDATIALDPDVDWGFMNFDSKDIVVNGNGATITGLNRPLIMSACNASVSISDLTIKSSAIEGLNNFQCNVDNLTTAGAFIGTAMRGTANLTNCHLAGSSVTATQFAAGLIGYDQSNTTISGCSVTGSSISAETAAGMIGLSAGNASVEGEVGGNTLSGEKAAKEGSVIGTLNSAPNGTIDVMETSESKGAHAKPLYVVGRLYQPVTYTGGSYFTNPELHRGDTNGVANPADGYTFVERTNGKFGLEKLPEKSDGSYDSIDKLPVTKKIIIKWDDKDNKRGIRPSKVIVNLYADGEAVDSVVVRKEDDWSKELTLQAYAKPVTRTNSLAKEIHYTVKQDAISGYTTSYSNDTFTITNKIKPRTAYSYSPDKLLQTGAEIQPIAMLTIAGVAALAASLWLVMKKKETYER